MANGTMTLIQTVSVGVNGQSAIDFTNIPQTYDDLIILLSSLFKNVNCGLFNLFGSLYTSSKHGDDDDNI